MKNITVLVSGSGTNLQRIIDCISNGEIAHAKINLVVADRECYGLKRAENNNIKTQLIKKGKGFSERLNESIPEETNLIVCAGFLSILNEDFCKKWNNKIINIHPSLLPKFGGKGMWGEHVHQAVLDSNEKYSGATVHFVTPGIDEGKILLQAKVPVESSDTVESLASKVHVAEYYILPKAIQQILSK